MKQSHPSIIAIDGPAASGKSTLGLRLAHALGYLFFDTGVMYRAVTWLALHRGINLNEEDAVTSLAEKAQIDVAPASASDGRACDVLVEGKDITWETRLPEVDANVSMVSAYRGVRHALSQQQRRIRTARRSRDGGTRHRHGRLARSGFEDLSRRERGTTRDEEIPRDPSARRRSEL
ncbi:MAG: (d)CMP kinase [Anaerolineales bacterium]